MKWKLDWKFIIVIVVIVAGVLLANTLASSDVPLQGYLYRLEHEDTLFLSNIAEPAEQLDSYASSNSFAVAFHFNENSSEMNTVLGQAALTSHGVIISNGKTSLFIVKVFDELGQLEFCGQSESGENEEDLSKEECLALLNSGNNVTIEFNPTNNTLKQSLVILKENKIEVFPKKKNDANRIALQLMDGIFGNTNEAISGINEGIGGVA